MDKLRLALLLGAISLTAVGCAWLTSGSVDRPIYQMLLDKIVMREMSLPPPVVSQPVVLSPR